jgi:hypothetical protein
MIGGISPSENIAIKEIKRYQATKTLSTKLQRPLGNRRNPFSEAFTSTLLGTRKRGQNYSK